MTRVSFHFNVPHRTDYLCRFLRKATRQGAKVVVAGPPPALAHIDKALWTFDPLEFLPHLLLKPGQIVPQRQANTPVWLLEHTADAPLRDVLVNLNSDVTAGFETFARVIEIVSTDEADRQAARQRWKHYAACGLAIEKYEVTPSR
jgi:DNA polymerase III subunit chi